MKFINRELDAAWDISYFVPCLNEEKNIGKTIDTIIAASRECQYSFEILVFDDHSRDRSVDVINEKIRENPLVPIRLYKLPVNRGLARNYVDGSYLARGRFYMLVNGDNAEPPESIKTIISQANQADIIIPVFKGNDQRTWIRRTISRIFTLLVNLLSGNNINYYNGPCLHRRFNIMRWHADTDGFAYQAETITRLIQEGATYKEVVVENHDRVYGASSAFKLKNLLAVSHSLFQILMRRLRYNMFYRNHAAVFTPPQIPNELNATV